uniref:Ankyrin repeat and MYND domain containing 2a n=1 Tax=Cyprinus carpio carpio TaxID=630221 RepID=A0A9J8CK09_CYPCA
MSAPKKGDLTDTEKELLLVIAAGNVQEASRLLGSKDVRVNCLDEYGMTPLMHAAYKGKADMCKLLLQHGADVNCNEHEHGYTALMFAGLSGKTDITWMMLDAGAETDAVNSVGRTAAQMAAFVGQHDCVTVINNFFSRARLDYYTKPQGLEKEPKLPPKLSGPLHKIIMSTNLNPVKIVMLVKENPLLMDVEALEKCRKVLELICEKCIKQQDMNEVLAMKMHYLSCVLQKCGSFLKERQDKLDGLIKSLLKGRDGDGFLVFQEKFIRECIRKFPYCDATLLQQLVRSIAPVEIGSDPTALSVLTQAITGQVGFMDADFCTTCGEKGAEKRCSICKMLRLIKHWRRRPALWRSSRSVRVRPSAPQITKPKMLPQRQSLLLQTESQRTNHFNPATITIIFTEDSSKTKESRSVTPPRGSEGFFIVLIPDALLKAHNVGENHQKHLHTNAQGEG